jgi:CBS domain-containing protein
MTTVRQILATKGTEVWSVTPDTSVYDAMALMAEKEVGALLVMEDGNLAGLVSERDYARKVVLEGKASRSTPVAEIMTTVVLHVSPGHSVEECMALMTDKRVRHLPVLEDDAVIGMVSIGDLVKAIIAEQRFVIEQLESYINR